MTKVKETLLKMERYNLGQLLAIGIKKDINIEHCYRLKSKAKTFEPRSIDIETIDGFYYLYLIR